MFYFRWKQSREDGHIVNKFWHSLTEQLDATPSYYSEMSTFGLYFVMWFWQLAAGINEVTIYCAFEWTNKNETQSGTKGANFNGTKELVLFGGKETRIDIQFLK